MRITTAKTITSVAASVFLSACGAGDRTDLTAGGTAPLTQTSGEQASTDDPITTGVADDGSGTGMPGGSSGPGSTGGEATGNSFIAEPDAGGATNECDLWAQDCPKGEKCMPWANDGGNSWNATKCSPIDTDPAQPGDPCTVEGSGVSGIDTCDIASMCWDVDPATNMGVCVGFCSGGANNPVCDDPMTLCSISNDGVLNLCLPTCDPLLQPCPDGQGCYPINDQFACFPDTGHEIGGYGDPCEFLNKCDPGLFCGSADAVPGCVATRCCTQFCDISDPGGDAQCMGEGMGQQCLPWYMDGQAPPGLEDVGACSVAS